MPTASLSHRRQTIYGKVKNPDKLLFGLRFRRTQL